jgi:alpha-galactosidase
MPKLNRLGVVLTFVLVSVLGVATQTASANETASSADVMAVGSRLVNGDGDTSGKCLEISNGGKGEGARVHMAGCHVNAHQSWFFTPVGNGWFMIRSHDADASGRCLTALPKGIPAAMYTCDGSNDQLWWTGRLASPGWFQLENWVWEGSIPLCLDVENNGQSNDVSVWDCGPSNKGNQLWKWASVG